jgi:hypothetical protein
MIAVVTRGYSADRAGVNPNETALTAPAVAKRGIKQLYSLPIPGDARGAEAQPLIAPGVHLAKGGVYDLAIVASMANQVLAFDANHVGPNDPEPLWTCSLGRPIDNTPAIDGWFNAEKRWINDHWGILSTPVIDLTTWTLYACSWASPDGSVARARHFLEAVSLASGARRQPIDLEGAVYDPGGIPPQKFASAARKQRASLLQVGQTIFIGFGSIFELAASNRGWVLAVDVKLWRQTAALCTAVTGSGGGIWQAGSGLAADKDGYIYAMTGNGDFDGKLEWGECFLKMRYVPPGPALMGELKVVDHWSPFLDSQRVARAADTDKNAIEAVPRRLTAQSGAPPTSMRRYTMASVDRINAAGNIPLSFGLADDMDLGSGGPVVIDELDLLLGGSKDGILYAVRKSAMGSTTLAQLQTAKGIAKNYAALACPPLWLTFFPGWSVSPMPSNIQDLNYMFGGKTHHQHGSLIVWKSPQGYRILCWGENSTLRMGSIEPIPNPSPDGPSVKIDYLAAGEEYASPDAPVPPGGMPGGFMCLVYDQARPSETPMLFATIPYGDANREVTRGRLLGYDLTQFKEGPSGAVIPLIWDSAVWNHEFSFNKFCTPAVDDGKLYVPTFDAKTLVYGLA